MPRPVSLRPWPALVLVALLTWTCTALDASENPFIKTGFPSGRDTQSIFPYEHVDPASGALVLAVTDLSLPGNAGLGLVVQRTYNSKIHPGFGDGDLDLEERSWVGVGWRLHFGRVIDPDSQEAGVTQIEMSDGSRHPLYHTSAFPEGWMTRGFWRYDKTSHTLRLPNGLIYVFGHVAAPNGQLDAVRYVTEIRDPYNNRLTFTYFAAPGPTDGVASVTQDLGGGQTRTVSFAYDPATNLLATMTFLGRTWTYEYVPSNVTGHHWLRAVVPPGNPPSSQIRWYFEYSSALSGGELNRLTAPAGGLIEFDYATVNRVVNQRTEPTRVVTQRRISGTDVTPGTWTFAYDQGAAQNETVVTTPCGVTRYRYHGLGTAGPFNAWRTGLLAERRVLEADGTEREREELTWVASEAVSSDPIPGEADGTWGDAAVYTGLLTERRTVRGLQSWSTYQTYRTGSFNDFQRVWKVTADRESGLQSKITEFTYGTGFSVYLLDRVTRTDQWFGGSMPGGADPSFATATYDPATGFLLSQTAGGVTTTYEKNAQGNVSAVIDGLAKRTELDYEWGVPSVMRAPLTTVTRSINADGTVASETIGGLTTSYGYDALMRVTHIDPPGSEAQSATTTIYYDNVHGRHVKTWRGAPGSPESVEVADAFGRPIEMIAHTGVTQEIGRDACGRVTHQSVPYTPPGDTWVPSTVTSYDALGRVTQVSAPAPAQGEPASVTTLVYTGIDVTVTDAKNHATTFDYDAWGGPAGAELARVIDADGNTTSYTYNRAGQLTRVVGPGINGGGPTRTWVYNANRQLTSDTQPEGGTTTYTYDAAGNLATVTDARGRVITLTYDNNNRLWKRTTPDDPPLTILYDAAGRASEQALGGVVTTFTFDAVGRPETRADTIDGTTYTTAVTYTAQDQVQTLTYPSARQVTYEYDGWYRLFKVKNRTLDFALDFGYDSMGRLRTYRTGTVTHTLTLDARHRPRRVQAGGLLDLTYQYDGVDNVTSITDPRFPGAQTFEYDALDRLRAATGPWGGMVWSYDAEGNRTSEQRGPVTTTYTYDATRRLQSLSGGAVASYTYFATGELQTQTLAGGTATFAYFTNGQVKQAQVPTVPPGAPVVADYVYGPDQLRIKRTVAGAPVYTLRGVGGEILSHYEAPCGALSWSRDDLYGAGRLLGSVRRAPTAFVAFVSAAGSVNEGTAQATVPVRVTTTNGQPLPCAATVSYQTTGGTATSDGDFAATSGTLTFPAGTASGTTLPITIPITNDTTDESDETLAVTLGTPTGASLGDPLSQPPQPATHTLTIVDNDLWPPLTINDVTVSESAGTATFTVTATGETALEVRVSYATVNGTARAGTDFTATTGTLVFEPGPPRTRTIAVPIRGDTWAEPTETFTVTLSNPVNATIADGTGVGTITDDDGPYQPINLALGGQFFADVDAGPTVDDYVLLANPHAVPVTVRFTAIRPNGSGLTRDVTVAAGSRTTLPLRTDPVFAGQGPISLAVQSLNAATPIEADHAQYWGTNWDGGRATEGVAPAPVWYLAEGAVGYFEEDLTLFNPQAGPVDVTLEAFTTAGAVYTRTESIPSGPGRVRLHVRDWLGVVDHGTRISAVHAGTSTPAAIVVERTMTWQADRREGHSTPGVSALSATWYFAEGNRGIFDTYLAFLNVHPVPVTVRVSYLHSNGGRYMTDVVVAARSRATLPTPTSVPTGDFGLDIVTLGGQGLAVERMVYGHTNWTVGHAGIGVPAPATAWRFAEGATGEFDTYFLVANPTASPATVSFTFTLATGGTVTTALAVPAGTRRYVLADTVAGLGTASFRTAVSATGPVVVERATYWWGVNGPSAMTAGDEPTVAGAEPAGLTTATPTLALEDGGGGDPSPPVLYQEVVDATAIEVVPPAPLEGRTLVGGDGAIAPLAASLPWIGGHLTSGRRP